MPFISQHTLIIWRLTDNKPGHEKQTLGLVDALARLGVIQSFSVPVQAGMRQFLDWAMGRFPAGASLAAPDLIVGAGHATHLPILAARRARGGRAVVLMKPSLPLALFDLCLIPEHDSPPVRKNVISTLGVLNNLTDRNMHEPGRGLLLIGGPSPHFLWNTEAIRSQIIQLVGDHPKMRWTLTTSRRTPSGFLDGLQDVPELQCHSVDETPTGWLEQQMDQAVVAWSTPDSVSMVYEALTAGCRVGLFDLAAVPGSRVAGGVARLAADSHLLTIRQSMESGSTQPPFHHLDEAGRCARLIMERWFQ